MLMQPSPRAETSGPPRPSVILSMAVSRVSVGSRAGLVSAAALACPVDIAPPAIGAVDLAVGIEGQIDQGMAERPFAAIAADLVAVDLDDLGRRDVRGGGFGRHRGLPLGTIDLRAARMIPMARGRDQPPVLFRSCQTVARNDRHAPCPTASRFPSMRSSSRASARSMPPPASARPRRP